MIYSVVTCDDGSFYVIDQWGDRHRPICCVVTGPTQKVRSKVLQRDGTWKVDETQWYYRTPQCKNEATHCYGDGIDDLFCDEHDPQSHTRNP